MVDPGGKYSRVSLSLFILARTFRTPASVLRKKRFTGTGKRTAGGRSRIFRQIRYSAKKMVVPKVGWGGTYCTEHVYESVANSFSPLAAIAVNDEIMHSRDTVVDRVTCAPVFEIGYVIVQAGL